MVDNRQRNPATTSEFVMVVALLVALGLIVVLLFLLVDLQRRFYYCPQGTCLSDAAWQYQYDAESFGAWLAGAGSAVLLAGSVVLARRRGKGAAAPAPPRSRRPWLLAELAVVGLLLVVAATAIAFSPPVSRSVSFSNSELTVVYATDNSMERYASFYASAGELVDSSFLVYWYANGSTKPVDVDGSVAAIQPGTAVNSSTWPWRGAENYRVPADGEYVLFFASHVCCINGTATAVAGLNVTVFNPGVYPPIQLASLAAGGGIFLAGAVMDRISRRPVKGKDEPAW